MIGLVRSAAGARQAASARSVPVGPGPAARSVSGDRSGRAARFDQTLRPTVLLLSDTGANSQRTMIPKARNVNHAALRVSAACVLRPCLATSSSASAALPPISLTLRVRTCAPAPAMLRPQPNTAGDHRSPTNTRNLRMPGTGPRRDSRRMKQPRKLTNRRRAKPNLPVNPSASAVKPTRVPLAPGATGRDATAAFPGQVARPVVAGRMNVNSPTFPRRERIFQSTHAGAAIERLRWHD